MRVVLIALLFTLAEGLWQVPFLSALKSSHQKIRSLVMPKLSTAAMNNILIAPLIGLCLTSPLVMIPSSAYAATNTASNLASSAKQDVPLYFGVGCFWHVQHEFIKAEERILGRLADDFTSLAGYAGGLKQSDEPNDLVCYHNLLGVGDYGKKGYGEVVGMSIPGDSIQAFAKEYFSLFTAGDRPDKGDRGPEYRSLIGLPGGTSSPYFNEINEMAKSQGLQLKSGRGNDPDTLGKKIVWIMDSNVFPFKQAEIYHQYHDGFMPGEQYPESYNSIVKKSIASGKISRTGCPDL